MIDVNSIIENGSICVQGERYAIIEGSLSLQNNQLPDLARYYVSIFCQKGNLHITDSRGTFALCSEFMYYKWVGIDLHSIISSDKSVKCFTLLIEQSFLFSIMGRLYFPFKWAAQNLPLKRLDSQKSSIIETFISLIKQLSSINKNVPSISVDYILHGFLLGCFPSQEMNSNRVLDPRLVKVIEQLDYDSNYSHSIDFYAQHVGITGTHLNRIMKETLGVSFTNYMKQIILSKAKSDLIMTNLPIRYISESLGFSEISNFTRYFKRETGLTPTQYREKNAHLI
ncbi:MAG: AraC family transcriptional regulator [Bacteroidales bacterium]|nr:AraC family transcriptional regulator [Bacteroidales bacterium]